jgi:hypothetical protein
MKERGIGGKGRRGSRETEHQNAIEIEWESLRGRVRGIDQSEGL